jgi:V/A-type H+-transporting ATPase subunit E
MGLDTVAEDIRENARERADEIVAAAEQEAEQIREAAREEAEQIHTERLDAVEATIEQEREQALSSATLEAKQERLEARRDRLQAVREAVEAELTALDDDRREELTRALLVAGSEEFDDDATVRVYGRADDADLLDEILTDFEGYEYAGERDCLGGVVLESDAARVRVNNTFDSVLQSVWEDDLQAISTRLFEE